MSHLYINLTMHHILMNPHWSIFIYAWYINDNSLIHIHLYIISMTTHWSMLIYAWHHMTMIPLDIYPFTSRKIHMIPLDVYPFTSSKPLASINPLTSINHLTSVLWHQSINPLASMTTWSNNIPLWHWWQYQHWCQH